MLHTRLTCEWGLKHPLVLAPMGGVAGGALTRAVSDAGGLGMIGAGAAADADWLGKEAQEVSRAERYGIGLKVWSLPERPGLFEAALSLKPFAVCLSFGDPAPYVGPLHQAGCLVLSQVQNSERAAEALEAGVDAVVAQGTEAGGHTGSVGTLPLLQRVLELAEPFGVPVIAAGGIGNGAGIVGALAMGAEAAWIGTRFAATDESTASADAKQRIENASETDTVHTHVFDIVQRLNWPSEFPGRALRNDFTQRWHGREDQLGTGLDEAAAGYEAARQAGDGSQTVVYAGQAAGLVTGSLPAATLVEQLMDEAEAILRRRFTELLGD